MDLELQAGRLYPSHVEPTAPFVEPAEPITGPATPPADAPAKPPTEMHERLYPTPTAIGPIDPDAPAHIVEMRKADRDRQMYSAQSTLASRLPDGSIEGADIAALREVLIDLDADHHEVASFRLAAKTYTNVTPETRATWRLEAAATAKREGWTRHDIEGAQALAARDPRVAKWADETGAGDAPEVLAFFVRKARSTRAAGKF